MERTVLGTCHHDCPDSCGWVVTVSDGVATKLRGNPAHPYSAGELCPKVNRFIDRVYSPDRILAPLRRSGAKGSGSFEPVSWDEALAEIAARWRSVIAAHGGEALATFSSAGTQGMIQCTSLDQRLFGALGASRLGGSLCGATVGAGVAATQGEGRGIDPLDLRWSKLIILWGTNTRLTNRHLWPTIEAARADGATVVVIDPLRTLTAESADWFLQPLPGTDGAVALAMMHVLVRDGLVDDDYVARATVGYEDLVARVGEWSPERVAGICGLAADDIERLAQLYGTRRPAAIRTLIGAEHHEHGAMFFRTLACLPLLVGAWRDRGGGLCRSTGIWAHDHVRDISVQGQDGPVPRTLNMNRLGDWLTDGDLEPPVHALMIWNSNPAVVVPNAGLVRQGLARDDLFTVVHEQFLTDTARYADIVLPATTQLEQRDVVPAWGHLYLGWNEPAIEPLGEAVANTELFRRLAGALGLTDPALFESDDELIAAGLAGLDPALVGALQRDGFVRLPLPEDLRPFAEGRFATVSGRAELRSDRLGALGHDALPDWQPARESPVGDPVRAARFPLVLLTPKQHARFLNSSYSHLPKHGPLEGGPYVELCSHDATEREIVDGDDVEVVNDRACLRLTARVSERVRPGVVAVPYGWWSADHGDGNVANALTNDTLTDWGGGVAYSDTLVEVRRGG